MPCVLVEMICDHFLKYTQSKGSLHAIDGRSWISMTLKRNILKKCCNSFDLWWCIMINYDISQLPMEKSFRVSWRITICHDLLHNISERGVLTPEKERWLSRMPKIPNLPPSKTGVNPGEPTHTALPWEYRFLHSYHWGRKAGQNVPHITRFY